MLVIATARNKQELNRGLLTSQGTHTFDRVLEIEPPHWSVAPSSGENQNKTHQVRRSWEYRGLYTLQFVQCMEPTLFSL